MAYNKPAVQVYQDLLNAGGAANITSDLPACIVGPANNVIKIDLNDEVAKVKSLAATIDTISTKDGAGLTVDWAIPVSPSSSFPGQVITDLSVSATLTDVMVKTFNTATPVWASGVATVTDGDNTIGASSNDPLLALPWTTTKNHVNVGDLAIVDSAGVKKVTFVTAVTVGTGVTTIKVADTSVSTGSLDIYTKFTSSVASVDWNSVNDVLNIGPTATTLPYATDTTYKYFVEKELKGYGSAVKVYIGYSASRSDIDGSILVISDDLDLENKLGTADPVDNPLAFGVSIALQNSGGAPVKAIAIDQSVSKAIGYSKALTLAEGGLLYWMVPLTTDISIQASFKAHVDSMSTPASGKWRVVLCNQEIPTEFYVLGRPDGGDANLDGFSDNLVEATLSGAAVILSSGDVGAVNAADDVHLFYKDALGVVKTADAVVSDASGTIITLVASPVDADAQGQVFLYVTRDASLQEQAQAIADQSKTWMDKRVLNFPGTVRVNTDVVGQNVPGYYLMCAVAGMGSGFPAQTGFTNITVAGIAGLNHSNFYFSESQLNLMAEFGTMLFVQESQETTPYCRHGLTTDVSVLEYREVLKVKNWDFLSYYYKTVISPFIGTWNITPDTLQNIRQTIVSASEVLLTRKLPKVGPPLLSYTISKLEQNANSSDAIDVEIQVAIVSPNNYTNIHLQI